MCSSSSYPRRPSAASSSAGPPEYLVSGTQMFTGGRDGLDSFPALAGSPPDYRYADAPSLFDSSPPATSSPSTSAGGSSRSSPIRIPTPRLSSHVGGGGGGGVGQGAMPTALRLLDESSPKPALGDSPADLPPAFLRPRPPRKKGQLFSMLPGEVLELILEQLKKTHLAPDSASCATCWMRDACSVAQSCRKWLKFARAALYEDIFLVGKENSVWKKKHKLGQGARLMLLRRTLKANRPVSTIVRSLRVPSLPTGMDPGAYRDLVTSVIIACPNLGRLIGFDAAFDGSADRLFLALSTRTRLRRMDWVVEAPPAARRPSCPPPRPSSSAGLAGLLSRKMVAPSAAAGGRPFCAGLFFELHVGWTYLSTLSIHCRPGAVLPRGALRAELFQHLPALRHLHLSSLPATACHDSMLTGFPPLNTLSLSNLPGVTCAGLAAFVSCSADQPVTTLTLRNVNLSSLDVLARILANLSDLRTLNVVQARPPALPKDEVVWLLPYLASRSLRSLHWDMTEDKSSPSPGVGSAPESQGNRILAQSISANGFPALRLLRVPNDPRGTFQSLCRPCERVELPTDRDTLARRRQRHQRLQDEASGSGTGTDTDSRDHEDSTVRLAVLRKRRKTSISQPMSYSSPPPLLWSKTPSPKGVQRKTGVATLPQSAETATTTVAASTTTTTTTAAATTTTTTTTEAPPSNGTDLVVARLAAQSRADTARSVPRFFVNVIDEDGCLADKCGLGGYMGTLGSPIDYCLLPDEGASDEQGGLRDVMDIVRSCGNDSAVADPDSPAAGDTCCGLWNAAAGDLRGGGGGGGGVVSAQKLRRTRWYHPERKRWRRVDF